ncbi:MAG TPA: fatty acid desaturase [Myxococcaceae bacterium]|nr:fatty acid desaturase [Myxococcaceae bacterium]
MSTQTIATPDSRDRLDFVSSIPFFLMHLACLAAFFLPVRPIDIAVAVGLYVLRMWGITAGFHRYFSHRAYQTGRLFQFILAWVGTMSAQKGVLWWAGNHRHHHRYSDQEEDIHSPLQRGFWWSHVGWILSKRYNETPYSSIRDFARFPELVWLNRFHLVPPTLLGVALFFIGGWSMLVWGLFISTVALWHGTFTINSLSHVFGSRRYRTTDTSRNNGLLALITLGEGWHNNHHYYQNTANQGWFWWEVDLSYYSLWLLSKMGVVKKLRKPTPEVRDAYLKYDEAQRAQLRDEGRRLRRRPRATRRPSVPATAAAAAAAAAASLTKAPDASQPTA